MFRSSRDEHVQHKCPLLKTNLIFPKTTLRKRIFTSTPAQGYQTNQNVTFYRMTVVVGREKCQRKSTRGKNDATTMTKQHTKPTKKDHTKSIRHLHALPKASNQSQLNASLIYASYSQGKELETIETAGKGLNIHDRKRTNITKKASTKAIRLSHARPWTPRRFSLNASSNDALHRRKQA